ncbi:MAG: MerR family transcriptional regulator [Deltaproteobacteria bacterium]|nr:MAG: MerR family transcriptional regulator [Deltaproteobacteria bacterium]
MPGEPLTTGQVARAAGVHVETLRFYERRGLLPKPPRRRSGYRQYPPDAVRIVRFIKRAQRLGFTLDEIAELLALRDDDRRACSEVRGAAEHKIAEIDDKIRALRAMRRALAELVATCADGDASVRRCPILEALADGRPSRRSKDVPTTRTREVKPCK